MYFWTSYPITCVLDQLWNILLARDCYGTKRKRTTGFIVELTSVMERILNYCYTGSVKTIARGLMDNLWCGRSLIQYGTPTLSEIITFTNGFVDVDKANWPMRSSDGQPYTASGRAQILTYGQKHFYVSPLNLSDITSVQKKWIVCTACG